MSDLTIDCLGLKCPLPVLMTRKRLIDLTSGASVTIFADDPLAPLDLAHLAQEEGLEVVRSTQDGPRFEVVLRRPA